VPARGAYRRRQTISVSKTLNQLLTRMRREENSGCSLAAPTVQLLRFALTRGRFDLPDHPLISPNARGREAILAVHARQRALCWRPCR